MALINWEDKFSVNVKEFDEHHKKLVGMINDLHEAMKVGKGREHMNTLVSQLVDYTKFHFSAEEKYMTQFNFPEYQTHKLEHDKFTRQALDLQKDLNDGKFVVTMDIMNFLKDWLVRHISGSDKKYGPFFNEKGLQ